jgi:hypothetical protein
MSSHDHSAKPQSDDPMEKIVHAIPYVIPAAGALLIFLLAFIAVTMA